MYRRLCNAVLLCLFLPTVTAQAQIHTTPTASDCANYLEVQEVTGFVLLLADGYAAYKTDTETTSAAWLNTVYDTLHEACLAQPRAKVSTLMVGFRKTLPLPVSGETISAKLYTCAQFLDDKSPLREVSAKAPLWLSGYVYAELGATPWTGRQGLYTLLGDGPGSLRRRCARKPQASVLEVMREAAR